ncbi:WD40 repeat domain-containing protein [Alkalimarinus alittae]
MNMIQSTLCLYARALKLLALSLIVLTIVGCGEKGPESKTELAVQGFLSGDISRDGRYAVVGSIHHGGSLWDVAKKERMFDWNHAAGEKSLIRHVSISGDGTLAATTVEDNVVLWETATGKSVAFWKAPARISALKLSWDGRYALLGMINHQAMYFDMNAGSRVFTFEHNAEVRSVDLSDDGLLGITGADDLTAKVWDLQNGDLLHQFNHRNQIKTVAISGKGKYGFTTSQREDSIIWDLKTGESVLKLPNRYTNFTAAQFSEDESKLLLGTFQGVLSIMTLPSGSVESTWQASPRKAYGGASSKAVVAAVFSQKPGGVIALMSDGMLQAFEP